MCNELVCYNSDMTSSRRKVLPFTTCICSKSKIDYDKFNPITGYKGREEEWRYSSTLSLTSVLDGVGVWGSVVLKALRY